jgi:hypothetical protein
MKLIFLFLLSCGLDKPKFKIGDRVRYDIPDKYVAECLNFGTVQGIVYTVTGKVTYSIVPHDTYRYQGCPHEFILFEANVREYFTLIREDYPRD